MESWKLWFMLGSGGYLILLGIFMFRKKDDSLRKGIGIYNLLVGALSIVAAIVAWYKVEFGNMIFTAYAAIMLISFIIFMALRAKENSKKGY